MLRITSLLRAVSPRLRHASEARMPASRQLLIVRVQATGTMTTHRRRGTMRSILKKHLEMNIWTTYCWGYSSTLLIASRSTTSFLHLFAVAGRLFSVSTSPSYLQCLPIAGILHHLLTTLALCLSLPRLSHPICNFHTIFH